MTTTQVKYITKSTLSWPDLWTILNLEKDNGGRWFAGSNSPKFVQEYCANYRTPSRAFPHSHAKPLLTAKFAKFLCEKSPDLALLCGVAEEVV